MLDQGVNISNLIPIVREAGAFAMAIYGRDFSVDFKDDKSPVTEADIAVDAVLTPALKKLFPNIPVISEEQAASHVWQNVGEQFFLVDPIDGTKEFINKTGEFTINIALIENCVPVAGIVYAPAQGRLFFVEQGMQSVEIDEQGNETALNVRDCRNRALTAVASRSHNTPDTQSFLNKYGIRDCVSAGSSLKFCVVAAGEADIYPRFGPTMEWDTAAGDAVLRGAGGSVLNIDRTPFVYGKPGFRNPNFIACSPEAAKQCPL